MGKEQEDSRLYIVYKYMYKEVKTARQSKGSRGDTMSSMKSRKQRKVKRSISNNVL